MFGLSINWSVPWSSDEVVNTVFLAVATVVVVAVPVVYGSRAYLKDPLARALLSGTSATAVAFLGTLSALIALHAGWNPPMYVWDWLARLTYVAVAVGKFTLLVALLRLLREKKQTQKAYDDAYEDGASGDASRDSRSIR